MMDRIFLLILATAGLFGSALLAEEVTFEANGDVKLGDREFPVDLALRLKDVNAKRISIESVVDLRRAKEILVEELKRAAFVDVCNALIGVTEATARADDTVISLSGRIEAELFRCESRSDGGSIRGENTFAGGLTVGASASAEFKDDCLFFRLDDLRLAPDQLTESSDAKGNVEKVRQVFIETANAILQRNPVCPELPPELVSLSPTYDAGGTRELGEGGVGLFFRGSIETSTEAIIDILQVLQSKKVLPPPPR
ncbi:hypothetical protein [Ruegeria faecimaris]|uniref:hypothetical protein n=1 Tax=Ruegeria faecimaris TaxID=686389 RepID=UPI002491F102|nr:hypothetical protein [Ruegeria faecimaris]